MFEAGADALIVPALAMASTANFVRCGPASAVLAEQFPTAVRYMGVAVTYHLAYVTDGLAALAATALYAATGTTLCTGAGMGLSPCWPSQP